MSSSAAHDSALLRPTLCLGGALLALPFVQTLPWDYDRSAPLALLTPAFIFGRAPLARACVRLLAGAFVVRLLVGLFALVALISIGLSPQPAAATVTLASWMLLALGGILAGQLATESPSAGKQLLGALALSAALGVAIHWIRWKLGAPPESAFHPHHRMMGLHLLGGTLAATGLLVAAPPRQRLAWVIVGAAGWGGLFWAGGRAPVGALGAVLLAWFAVRAKSRRPLFIAATLHLALGFLLAVMLDAGQPHLGWKRLWQASAASTSAAELTSNRSDFWRSTAARAAERPLFGHGPDAYRFLEPKLEGAQPHNLPLQLWLEVGLFGAVAALVLAALALWRGYRRREPTTVSDSWLAIAVASLVGAQMDGFFHHLAGLFTATLALGITALGTPSQRSTPPAPALARLWWLAALPAALVLLVHTWLFDRLVNALPPQPTDSVVRIWRAFPSTSLGIERWLEAWTETSPDAALALARHAQQHSAQGDFIRVQTAGLLLRRGDRVGALRELDAALAIAPWQMRPVIKRLREQVAVPSPTPAPR